ncbi:hypothetical protein [Microbacterium sp.]|uniref:hypothetical protein n=1 Tax=Microbacterium sp. TaxID=51671 RepID=UPI003F9E2E7F
MVRPADDPQQRKHSSLPFLSRHDGAPPTPPPEGYQHARRFPSSPFVVAVGAPEPPERTAPKPTNRRLRHPFGWSAIAVAAVFALVLLVALAMGATDAIYGATMLALQLIVLAAVIAAVVVAPSRVLGSWALAIVLVLNVGTVGAMSALRTSAAGTYGGQPGNEQPGHSYPGIKGVDEDAIMQAPSLEATQSRMDELSARIRAELSDEFGFTWVKISDPLQRNERNGYGGESMLQQHTAPVWATEQPVHGYGDKLEVMDAIDEVLYEEGVYYSLYPLNEPYDNISDDSLEQLYGSADPAQQVRWSYYTQLTDPGFGAGAPEPPLFYAEMIDLTHDDTGRWKKQQEAENAKNGTPMEGVQLMFYGTQLLSEADRDAFEKALEENPEP